MQSTINFSDSKVANEFNLCSKELKQTIKDALSDCSQGREANSGDEFYVPVNDPNTYYTSGQGEPDEPYYYIAWDLDHDLHYVIDSIDLISA